MTKAEDHDWKLLANEFIKRIQQDFKINSSDIKYLARDFAKETNIDLSQATKYIEKALEQKKQKDKISTSTEIQVESQDEIEIEIKKEVISIQKSKNYLVECSHCGFQQVYVPIQRFQKRCRKNCKKCNRRFSINFKTIITSIEPTPSLASTGTAKSEAKIGKKASTNQTPFIDEIIKFLNTKEINSTERKNLIAYLKNYNSENSQNEFFYRNKIEGGQGVGGGHVPTHSNAQPSSRKNVRPDYNSNKKRSDLLRGGIPTSKSMPIFDSKNDSNAHFHVEREPLDSYLLKLQEQFALRQDYALKDYEDLAVKRFGLTVRIANKLRKKMKQPNHRDPAQQYRLDLPEQFTLILSKKNTCLFYPKHPNAVRELNDFVKAVVSQHEYESYCYLIGEHEVLDKVEIKVPRIQGLRQLDPLYWKFDVRVKDGKQQFIKYAVSRDHSKNEDNIEFRGLTKEGQEFFALMTQTQFEFSLGNMNRRLNQSILNSQLTTHSYLQNNVSTIQTTLSEIDDRTFQLQRDLKYHLRRDRRDETLLKKQLAVLNNIADINSESGRKIDDLTIEISKLRQSSKFSIYYNNSKINRSRSTTQDLLELIKNYPGITRKELDLKLSKYHGYANRIVFYYKGKGIIREEKEGRKAGRLFLNSTHLDNKNKGDATHVNK